MSFTTFGCFDEGPDIEGRTFNTKTEAVVNQENMVINYIREKTAEHQRDYDLTFTFKFDKDDIIVICHEDMEKVYFGIS